MKVKRALSITLNVLTTILIVLIIFVIISAVVSITAVGKTDRSFWGYRIYIVQSDSMEQQFEAGDLIFSKVQDDYTDLEAGTIITFISEDPLSFGETITHMIRESTTYNGSYAYITYGTTTGTNDGTPCPVGNILGVYSFKIANVGYFFNFLKTTAGYVTVILVPLCVLIALSAYKFISTLVAISREKKAAAAGAEAEERDRQAELQRQETQRLRDELEALKSQLSQQPSQSAQTSQKNDTPQDGGDK